MTSGEIFNNFQCVPIRMFICAFIAKKKFQKDL